VSVQYYPPTTCEYCGTTGDLTEHHLVRRSAGGTRGKTIWLCFNCHRKATDDKKFELNLQRIFLTPEEVKNKGMPLEDVDS